MKLCSPSGQNGYGLNGADQKNTDMHVKSQDLCKKGPLLRKDYFLNFVLNDSPGVV